MATNETLWREVGIPPHGRLGHQRGVVDGRPVIRIWSRRWKRWTYYVVTEAEQVIGNWTVEKVGDVEPPPMPDWATRKEET